MDAIETYIQQFPESTQERLAQVRALIHHVEPEAVESISYGMPAYKLYGKPLMYFAGFAHHVGIYALPITHAEFAGELKQYKQGKGSVQFPHTQELPLDIIERMLRFRAQEIRA